MNLKVLIFHVYFVNMDILLIIALICLNKYLRHPSLDKNVFYAWLKADTCRYNIKQNIHVQKIKVEKTLINSLLLK